MNLKIIRLDDFDNEKITQVYNLLEKNGFKCTLEDMNQVTEINNLLAEKRLEFEVVNLNHQIEDLENLYNELTKRVRGFIKIEIPSGKVSTIDKFLEELSGYPLDTWKSTSHFLKEITHPDFKEYYLERLSEMERGIVPKVMEYKIIRKNGEERWWLQFNIGTYNIDAKLIAISAVIIDNTEHKETQIKYQNLFENINAGMFRTNLDTGEILDANQRLAQSAGYSSVEEFRKQGKALRHYFNSQDREKVIEILKKEGKVTDQEIQMVRKDGSIGWVSLSASYYPNENFCEGVLIDISARKEAEKQLRESEEKFRSLVEQSVAGIILVKDNNIIFANEVVFRQSGYAHSTISSMSIEHLKDIVHPDDVENVLEQFKLVKEFGVVPEFFCRIITRDNRVIWLSAQLKKFPYENGFAIIAVVVEITKRMELAEKLQKERNRAEKYFDIAGTLLVVLDKDANIVEINRRGCEILEYTREEIIGKNWIETFLPERVRDGVRKTFSRVISGKVLSDECYENYVLTKNNEERLISWYNAVLQNDDGEIEAVISSGEDITDWRLAEKLLQDWNALKKK
ncbi:MAG: PAS domain S-box protein [Candidatus Thorarchaeota archaeon]